MFISKEHLNQTVKEILVLKKIKSFCNYKIINIDPTESPTKSSTRSPTIEIPTKTVSFTETEITDFSSYSPSNHHKLKIGIIIKIVCCCVVLVLLIVVIIIYIARKRKVRQPIVNPVSLLDSDN